MESSNTRVLSDICGHSPSQAIKFSHIYKKDFYEFSYGPCGVSYGSVSEGQYQQNFSSLGTQRRLVWISENIRSNDSHLSALEAILPMSRGIDWFSTEYIFSSAVCSIFRRRGAEGCWLHFRTSREQSAMAKAGCFFGIVVIDPRSTAIPRIDFFVCTNHFKL